MKIPEQNTIDNMCLQSQHSQGRWENHKSEPSLGYKANILKKKSQKEKKEKKQIWKGWKRGVRREGKKEKVLRAPQILFLSFNLSEISYN